MKQRQRIAAGLGTGLVLLALASPMPAPGEALLPSDVAADGDPWRPDMIEAPGETLDEPQGETPAATPTGDTEEERLAAVADAIDLDESTRARIRALAKTASDRNTPRRTAVRQARLTLRSLLEQPVPDEAAVMAQIDALSDLQRELWRTRVQALIEIRSLLTPRQRDQLADLRRLEESPATGACRDDVRKLCPDALTIRASLRCLIDRRDEISDGCRERLAQGRLARFFEDDEDAAASSRP